MQQVFDKHYILWALKLMLSEVIKEPKWGLSKAQQEKFKLATLRKWAADDLLNEIKLSNEPPDLVVEAWVNKVCHYTNLTLKGKEIFEAAKDVGEIAEDILLGMM